MIKIEKVEVFGWEAAIRGMRNPMNSWDKSDSDWCWEHDHNLCVDNLFDSVCCDDGETNIYCIGENDLKLMKNLSKAGNDDGKFLRMINVTMDITAPLYWYKEFDTYKVGTVANSCSTMHKVHAKEFTLDDFSHEHLIKTDGNEIKGYKCCVEDGGEGYTLIFPLGFMEMMVDLLNDARRCYLDTKDKKYWWQMIQLLPSSYNQKRTVQLNYQVLKTMYFARKNHKLDEWREFCAWCETLPYFKEIILNE